MLADATTSRIVAELGKNVNVGAPLEKRFAISISLLCKL